MSNVTYRRRREGRLRFCPHSGRYVLDGWELHCGDTFQVLLDAEWVSTRIEYGTDWVLVGVRAADLEIEGLEARSHD
jgi:hypothetical protein